MKTKLTLACLALSLATMAQVSNQPTVFNISEYVEEYGYGIVPQSLSFDGTNRVYIRTADEQVAIYSNAFTPVKSFSITPIWSNERRVEAERTVTVTVTGGEETGRSVVCEWQNVGGLLVVYYQDGEAQYNIPNNWNNDSITKCLTQTIHRYPSSSNIITSGDSIFFIPDWDLYTPDHNFNSNDYYKPDLYGKQYVRNMILLLGGFMYSFFKDYEEIIEYSERQSSVSYSDWAVTNTYTSERAQTYGLGFTNYDNDQQLNREGGDGLCLTQTLFNEDEKYEYLSFPIDGYTEPQFYYPDEPVCGDCYSESQTYTQLSIGWSGAIYRGFDVMSEDGTTLQSVSFPTGFQMIEYVTAQIIKLSDEYYLICSGELNNASAMLVYKINHTGSGASVQQVSEPQQISSSYKFLRHGNVYIKQGNRTISVQGQEMRQ